MTLDEQIHHLTRGLVGDKYRRLYVNNVHFHASVDTLVAMLPLWIDGLADRAEDARESLELLMKVARIDVQPLLGPRVRPDGS